MADDAPRDESDDVPDEVPDEVPGDVPDVPDIVPRTMPGESITRTHRTRAGAPTIFATFAPIGRAAIHRATSVSSDAPMRDRRRS